MATKLDYRNDEKQDERLDPYSDNARHLYNQEQDAYDREFNDIVDNYDQTADESARPTKNIDDTKEKEQDAGWTTNVTSGGDKKNSKQPVTVWQQVKKKGPLATIIALVGGGGLLGGGLLSPAGALIHIKEILVNKFDTMSSVVETRSALIMKGRMFSTNATCKIKVRCRFSGLTSRQMDRLRVQGADVLDKDGKPITKNALGRYTGGKTLVLEDGTKIDAKDYLRQMRTNPAARTLSRSVFAPRYLSWNDSVSKKIRADKKLVTNPDWDAKDGEKGARESIYKATSGEAYTADNQDVPDSDKYEMTTDENGNPTPKLDENGNPIPKQGTTSIPDFGDATDAINQEETRLQQEATVGNTIDPIPSDPAGAATMPEVDISGRNPLKSVVGFLNPTDFLVGLCGTYKLTNGIIVAAKTLALANAMRYASQFLSTADKIKAGDATGNDAAQAMTILERADQYGDSFGDSVGYQYTEYGSVPDKSIASSAEGNGVIQVFEAVIRWINSNIGETTVKTGCNILANPVTQGILALTSFIPGGGQLVKGITKAISASAKVVAERAIKDAVDKIVKAAVKKTTETLTKDAVKTAAKTATKAFIKMAAGAGGIFLASYLTERYAVPYLARVLSGTMLTGSEDGVTSMDTIANGFDATNQITAQQRGLVPLSKEDAAAFEDFNDSSTSTYVADMRAQSNPFDINDPYSASNALASSFYNFASKIKSSSLLSAPAAIISALNPSNLFSSAFAADNGQNTCDDDYLNSKDLATSPFCNVVMGFNDVNMLENADPDTDVTQWMLDHKQIDNNGDPVDGSDFAKFVDTCITDEKQISDVGDDDTKLPETCSDTQANATQERKMFHLYVIDTDTVNSMDAPDEAQTDNGVSYISVGNIPDTGLTVGASVFGGKQSGGKWVENLADNGGNDLGDHGNHLTGVPAIAELDNGTALGNIPDGTKLEIDYNGKKIIAVKEDVGAGGADVDGHPRAIDLWWQTANLLGFNNGTGVVTIHAVDSTTSLTPVATTGDSSLKNIGFSLSNLLSLVDYNVFAPYSRGTVQ